MLTKEQIYYLNTLAYKKGLQPKKLPPVGKLKGFCVETKGGFLEFRLDYSLYATKHLPSTDVYVCDLIDYDGVKKFVEEMI